jgi:hypothetical protein
MFSILSFITNVEMKGGVILLDENIKIGNSNLYSLTIMSQGPDTIRSCRICESRIRSFGGLVFIDCVFLGDSEIKGTVELINCNNMGSLKFINEEINGEEDD